MPRPITQNTLFYGDNLRSAACFCRPILREYFPDECIDQFSRWNRSEWKMKDHLLLTDEGNTA